MNLFTVAIAFIGICAGPLSAEEFTVETIPLPALRIAGKDAAAHTQGLELIDGSYLVTARREDVRPNQALLLRTAPGRTTWDVWDITPADATGKPALLNHPGGMQSDGEHLWIPLAESRRNGRSLIRAYPLSGLVPGRPLKPDLEFPVDDHIGAVAVGTRQKQILGAGWDTERVHVWDLAGHPQRTLTVPELKARHLGVGPRSDGRSGVTVQDWKMVGDRLFASGLFRDPGSPEARPASRLSSFTGLLEPTFREWSVVLPLQRNVELSREAMAVADGWVHFLPEDLGATNRVFRLSLAEVTKAGARATASPSVSP